MLDTNVVLRGIEQKWLQSVFTPSSTSSGGQPKPRILEKRFILFLFLNAVFLSGSREEGGGGTNQLFFPGVSSLITRISAFQFVLNMDLLADIKLAPFISLPFGTSSMQDLQWS